MCSRLPCELDGNARRQHGPGGGGLGKQPHDERDGSWGSFLRETAIAHVWAAVLMRRASSSRDPLGARAERALTDRGDPTQRVPRAARGHMLLHRLDASSMDVRVSARASPPARAGARRAARVHRARTEQAEPTGRARGELRARVVVAQRAERERAEGLEVDDARKQRDERLLTPRRALTRHGRAPGHQGARTRMDHRRRGRSLPNRI